VCFHRPVDSHREVRRVTSVNRYSKNSDIPNNKLERATHTALGRSSLSTSRGAQGHTNTRNCDKLLEPHEKRPKCQSFDYSSNQKHDCDEVSDMIVTVKTSSYDKTNSHTTPITWPKALLRAAKKPKPVSGGSSQMTEPYLRDTQLCSQQETCM